MVDFCEFKFYIKISILFCSYFRSNMSAYIFTPFRAARVLIVPDFLLFFIIYICINTFLKNSSIIVRLAT